MSLTPTHPENDSFDLANHFNQNEHGIWHSPAAPEALSYPDDGHANCLGIEDGSLWFLHRSQCLAELLKAFPPSGALFDIGGGNGAVSLYLQNEGHKSYLVEPGPNGAMNARKRGLRNVICGTTTDLKPFRSQIPAIGLFDVLEHIEDDAKFLVELHRLLQDGGRLYLTVPAYAWLWSNSDVRAMHFRRYSPKQLRRVLEKAGFEIEYQTGMFAPLIPGIFLFRSLFSLWGRRGNRRQTNQQRQKEHGASKSFTWRCLMQLLKHDIHSIHQKKNIVGASLLCAARKS